MGECAAPRKLGRHSQLAYKRPTRGSAGHNLAYFKCSGPGCPPRVRPTISAEMPAARKLSGFGKIEFCLDERAKRPLTPDRFTSAERAELRRLRTPEKI